MATAIYDGADGIMLSAESAAGKFPLESVRMQQKIISSVENDEVGQGWGGGPCLVGAYHESSCSRCSRIRTRKGCLWLKCAGRVAGQLRADHRAWRLEY